MGMKWNLPLRCACLAAAVFLIPDPLQGGTIEGTIPLPAARKRVTAPQYISGGGEVGPASPVVAVVYLKGDFAGVTAPEKPVPRMEQRGFQFHPSVVPVQVGGKVEFPNRDSGYHNVFSYSSSKRFDLGRYRKDEEIPSVTFEKAGEVKLYCEIHDHMRAMVLVLETPFFTSTDAEGKFRLEGVPPGRHELVVWILGKTTTQPVEVPADGVVRFPSS